MATVAESTGRIPRGEAWRGWLNLFCLCLIGLLSSLHFQLIFLLIQPVKLELQLSDAEIGLITGTAVAVITAVAAFPIGWAADRFGRRLLLACSVVFWSLMTAACGLATSFVGFLAASGGLALGEAGIYGIMYAMIPAIVPERRRNAANTILLSVLVISASFGLILGGAFLSFLEGLDLGGQSAWRVVFIAAGLGGVPFALLAAVIRPLSPRRRQPEPTTTPAAAARFTPYFRKHWLVITVIFTALGLYGSAWTLWSVWAPALYTRNFGVSPAIAGQTIGWVNLVGCLLALVVANLLYGLTRKRLGHRFAIRTLTLGCTFALLPLALVGFDSSRSAFLLGYLLETASLVLAVSIAPMLLQDIAPPNLRSRVTGLVAPIGLPIRMAAPAVTGMISDSSGEYGLLFAVCLVSAVCLILAIACFALFERRYAMLIAEIDGDTGQ